MANWWGGMSGAQAVQMGQNIFNLAQQQAQQQQELQRQQQQQETENFFTRMQLNMQKEKLGLEAQKLKFDKDRLIEEDQRRKDEFIFEQKKWQEELGFRREKLKESTQEKPDLAQFPKALEEATKRYEATGNWGEVQAVQEAFGIPVDKDPRKTKEIKDAISVWREVDKAGLPLKVDRKFGPGGEEQSLPPEIIKKYGIEGVNALGKLTKGRMDGILGSDKYRQNSITSLYEMYFKIKRFLAGGKSKEEIIAQMKKSNLSEDLINDMFGAL